MITLKVHSRCDPKRSWSL